MRIIDADALKKRLVKCAREGVNLNFGIARLVETAPTIDAVEVVRCKDCKYIQHDTLFGQYWCNGRKVTAEWYCADAERRSDGAD